jgi:hypothetical protein
MKYPAFCGTGKFSMVFKDTATISYPEPDETSPYLRNYFPKINVNIVLSFAARSS